LTEHFGGAQFIQVLVEGDLRDPVHLRRLRELSERVETLNHVARVQYVGQPVALLNEMMEGQRRIPDNRAKVESLMGFLTGNPAVRQLANEERTRALMHITVGTNKAQEIETLLKEIESLVDGHWFTRFKVVAVNGETRDHLREEVGERLHRILEKGRFGRDKNAIDAALKLPVASPDDKPVREAVVRHLMSAEAMVPVTSEQAQSLASAVVALGPDPSALAVDEAVAGVMELPIEDALVADLGWSIGTPLEESWSAQQADAAVSTLAASLKVDLNPQLAGELRLALLDRNNETVGVVDGQDPPVMQYTVSGLPVMHRGLSHSVTANQFKSLGFALGLVAVILTVAFRSVSAGLLATAPTALA